VPHTNRAAGLEIARLLGQDERRDALRTRRRIGDGRDHEHLADAGVRDEALRTVEQVVAVLLHRRGAGAAGIAAGRLLGEAEAAEHLPRREQRHVALLLRLRAEVHDGRRAQRRVRRNGDAVRRVDARSSSMAIMKAIVSKPAPPSSSDQGTPSSPSSPIFLTFSQGNDDSASWWAATGETCSSANARTISRTARCESLK
jgi:hypothetical protein